MGPHVGFISILIHHPQIKNYWSTEVQGLLAWGGAAVAGLLWYEADGMGKGRGWGRASRGEGAGALTD
jgi:hypothetical protein